MSDKEEKPWYERSDSDAWYAKSDVPWYKQDSEFDFHSESLDNDWKLAGQTPHAAEHAEKELPHHLTHTQESSVKQTENTTQKAVIKDMVPPSEPKSVSFTAEDGKVYLPNPPPPLAVDKILNERDYLSEKLSSLTQEPKKGGTGAGVVIGFFILFAVLIGAISNTEIESMFSFFIYFVVVVGFFLIILFSALKRSKAEKNKQSPEAFRLISPYAIKSECQGKTSAYALRVYYMDGNVRREAVTDAKFSRADILLFEASFRRGQLVVACLKSNSSNYAVICES
jgi:hypothetical protein